jgi:NIMA (never in mitosis gene a)-related kinase 1/4/5
LTGNNTIKIGDFGISKVLETTCQNAQTVVGTPYYMAPEACQSEPYTSKSDVWALGCIMYELCTLKKAFEADNLLGLVFKIVTENTKPIAKELPYSKELRMLIDLLLEKDPKLRPSVAQILQMNLVK